MRGEGRLKPLDGTRNIRRKKARSMEELRDMKRDDIKFSKFQRETVMDTAFEKELDGLIDEQMAKGKTDQEIIAYVGGLTGLGPQQPESEEENIEDEEELNAMDESYKQFGPDLNLHNVDPILTSKLEA